MLSHMHLWTFMVLTSVPKRSLQWLYAWLCIATFICILFNSFAHFRLPSLVWDTLVMYQCSDLLIRLLVPSTLFDSCLYSILCIRDLTTRWVPQQPSPLYQTVDLWWFYHRFQNHIIWEEIARQLICLVYLLDTCCLCRSICHFGWSTLRYIRIGSM